VIDLGCGRRSTITNDMKIAYNCVLFAIDISEDELSNNDVVDHSIVYDVCNPRFAVDLKNFEKKFDLIISNFVLEHLVDPSTTHKMVYFVLADNGIVIHRYPTLYEPAHLVNLFLPSYISEKILFVLEPHRRRSGKFKVYYRFCRAYSDRVRSAYERSGFQVVQARNFYGTHSCYWFFPLHVFMSIFHFCVMKLGLRSFASLSWVILLKNTKAVRPQ